MTKNSTYLFERPRRDFRNAESWWTAYFSMLVLWEVSQGREIELPWYRSDPTGNLSISGSVKFEGASFSNVVVDGKLKGAAFSITPWPDQFLDLRPDVTILDPSRGKAVTFVEVKTIGASVARNIYPYDDLVKFLRDNGWVSDVYYLLSEGHEAESDWKKLCECESRILKWEDVLRKAVGTPFGELFDLNFEDYTGES